MIISRRHARAIRDDFKIAQGVDFAMTLNQRHLKLGLVAFIDLLGFSSRVERLVTIEDLERIERDVGRVQSWFDHKPTDESIKESQKITAKSVLAFSDCIVICVPVRSELTKVQGDFDVLMSELVSFAITQGRCALNGIFLRGGVDLGIWYKRKDTLISPAMVKSYHLERQACVPMIAVTDDLYGHLSKHRHRGFYHETVDPIPKVLRHFEGLPNGTSQWFIDYMPICLEAVDGSILSKDREVYSAADPETRDRIRNEAYWRDCREWIGWHRDGIRTAHAAATVDAVRTKYVWLAAYHDDAVERFFGTAPPDLLIGNLTASTSPGPSDNT
ncbi:MAG: hypothetical protein ACREKL_15660 [Chthoniobacterales bacterium]